MEGVPAIRYARAGPVSLAYQVFGDGPVDVVVIPPMAQNIETMWERPEYREVFDRLGRFARVVHFDKRGTGSSDRTLPVPTLDERVDDARAVMDAVGMERAVLYGVSEGGPMAVMFAVRHPERVDALVLHATSAVTMPAPLSADEEAEILARAAEWIAKWGTDETITLALFAPTAQADDGYRAWQPRYERYSATPAALWDLLAMYRTTDVRELLGQVRCPTMVVHRRDDLRVPIADAVELAEAIPGARLVIVDGVDHFPHIGDVHEWLDEIERFLTGGEPTSHPKPSARRVPGARIETLGGFAVVNGGSAVPLSQWGSRRARMLCKRLAAEVGAPVPRDELVELLWPDDSSERLGARLSVQLSTLRRLVGRGIAADRDAVRLDLEHVALDLATFHSDVAAGRLEAAVAAYRGPFLPEDAYEPWAAAPREIARASYQRALRQLVDAAEEIGDHDRAVTLCQRLLGEDPYDVDANERLERVLAAAGRHGDVGRARELSRSRMREIGVDVEQA